MTVLNKQALREAVNAANIASWGKWESYKPHKGARGYEVRVGAKAVAQHCLKVDSAFIAAANPSTVIALLDALEAAENNLIDSECHVAELEEALRDKQALLEALDNSLCELLPGTQYMDPPDGGSVTPLEQVRRMVAAYRNRIAELEARDEPKFVKCWSCKHDIEVLAIVDCDGYCPRCAAPIDLDDEPYAGIGVKGE
ncbi:ead/Ea22-like family protein [Citrobacter freundii]|uniref:ead/Ea22-like family protein n=1 Tax=Citrobacter freundii TaxID=546 RepID=UPI00227D3A8C|nr:ead/Ea22-like family protein [Citrobacter freundii]